MHRQHAIEQAVYDHWVETGEPMTRAQIAEKAGISASTVGKSFADDHPRVTETYEVRDVTGKGYGEYRYQRKVAAYYPSLDYIRAKTIEAREKAGREGMEEAERFARRGHPAAARGRVQP